MTIKNVKHVELNISNAFFFLEYKTFKDDLIEYTCLSCNKHYQRKFYRKSKEQYF